MDTITLHINGQRISVEPGSTLLQAARQIGLDIPTLCYLDGLQHTTSCMICVVEDMDSGKLIPSCSAQVCAGQNIETTNPRIHQFRKDTLDLLLSEHVGDCQAPCHRICPAYMNIPLMIRQIQQQDWRAAIKTVKADIPLPAVLGRICPAPCEKGCTRGQHDQPVSICLLKRIVADIDLKQEEPYQPECEPDTGKQVGIIGAGQAGLSAAYYLRQFGHTVTMYDQNAQPGGNLQYAVPTDRLDKHVLQAEIDLIRALNVLFEMNKIFGSDLTLEQLENDFDAVILATGKIDPELYENTPIQSTERGLQVDRKTLTTNRAGVFAGGSLVSQSKMAVRAVGHGKTLAHSVHQYLTDSEISGRPSRFNSILGRLKDGEENEFLKDSASYDRLEPRNDEDGGYQESEAVQEANRCFHCDCRKLHTCQLRLYSDQYEASQGRYKFGVRQNLERHVQHDMIVYEPGKCIKCELCVKITEQAAEPLGLAIVNRGFDVRIRVPFDESLTRGLQRVAIECVNACPTAALSMKNDDRIINRENDP